MALYCRVRSFEFIFIISCCWEVAALAPCAFPGYLGALGPNVAGPACSPWDVSTAQRVHRGMCPRCTLFPRLWEDYLNCGRLDHCGVYWACTAQPGHCAPRVHCSCGAFDLRGSWEEDHWRGSISRVGRVPFSALCSPGIVRPASLSTCAPSSGLSSDFPADTG